MLFYVMYKPICKNIKDMTQVDMMVEITQETGIAKPAAVVAVGELPKVVQQTLHEKYNVC